MLCYKKNKRFDFIAFYFFADEIRTFDGKTYRIKGMRCQRIDHKRLDISERKTLRHLSEVIYKTKTVFNDNYGLIAYRKKVSQELKSVKNISISKSV
ncbi:TPA: hypothetical protein R8D17_002646 [Staphylococcus aureus]|nr:hypothetical protein [Staphylococcus aureus]